MAKTIRDIIAEKSELLRNVEQLGPGKASEELVELCSLLSSLKKYVVEKNYWYNIQRQNMLKEHGKGVLAKIHAEASAEWKDWQEAKAQEEALEELIRSIKYYLRGAEKEIKEFTQ